MKRLFALALLACCASASASQTYTMSAKGSGVVCSDKTVLPEVSNLMLHSPRDPLILKLSSQGGCSPVLADFTVLAHEILNLPAGPQKIVEIAIPNLVNPTAPPETAWAMASDIELVRK